MATAAAEKPAKTRKPKTKPPTDISDAPSVKSKTEAGKPGMFDFEIEDTEMVDALNQQARLKGDAQFQEQRKQLQEAKNVVKAFRESHQEQLKAGTRLRVGVWALEGGVRTYGGFKIPKREVNVIKSKTLIS